MQQYMDGTTSSSLYELKLGRQKFAGETHAYSVAWADDEIEEMVANCDKIIFNSIGQLERFAEATEGTIRGLRVNPQVSSSTTCWPTRRGRSAVWASTTRRRSRR